MRRQWLSQLLGASFVTTSYVTLAGVDISVLLESAYQLLSLLNEIGYHLLVVLEVLALSEDFEYAIERSAHCTFAILRVEVDSLVPNDTITLYSVVEIPIYVIMYIR